MKRTEDRLRETLGEYKKHQFLNYRGPRRRKEKERVEKYFEDILV